jgi:hypothetical protein
MPSSVSCGMVAVKHQQGWSAAGLHSAHWLGWPQSGQRDGSTGSLMAFPFNDELRVPAGQHAKPAYMTRWPGLAPLSGLSR